MKCCHNRCLLNELLQIDGFVSSLSGNVDQLLSFTTIYVCSPACYLGCLSVYQRQLWSGTCGELLVSLF